MYFNIIRNIEHIFCCLVYFTLSFDAFLMLGKKGLCFIVQKWYRSLPWSFTAAISKSPCQISGSIECGTQYHFQLETQYARCLPSDDGGMNVEASTQWIDGTSEIVASVLNIPRSRFSYKFCIFFLSPIIPHRNMY